jgi:hypothetical protein
MEQPSTGIGLDHHDRGRLNVPVPEYIHDYMAEHTAWAYPGFTDGDTAGQLFALLADVALAYLMEVEAEVADPGPGQSLAGVVGLSAKATLLTALSESLDVTAARDLGARKPGRAPFRHLACYYS